MAINKLIKIQKLTDMENETWEDYYSCLAEINKASGKEYFNAKTNVTQNTYNFKVRYISKLQDIIFNTSQYRILYQNKEFDITNADDKQEKHIKITFVAECVTV